MLIGGGRPSRDILVAENLLYEIPLKLGYKESFNENAIVRGNWIVQAGLSIKRFQRVEQFGNKVLAQAEVSTDQAADLMLRKNRYDERRAHLAAFN